MAADTPSPSRLFRPQAVEHAGVRSYGTVLLARPLSHTVLTAMFAAIAVGIVLFFLSFSYQRKIHVSGVLLPEAGLIRVVAPQAGVVVALQAREGQAVRAGEPLFVLASERSSATRGDAASAVSSLLQGRLQSLLQEREHLREQAEQRRQAGLRKAEALQAEQARIDAQIALQQARVGLAAASLQRTADLQAQHFVSTAQVQDRQGDLIDQRQRLGELERAKSAIQREFASVQAELRDQRIQADRDQAGADRTASLLEQDLTENEARREVVVRAPHDGVVAAVNAELGQAVSGTQPLTALLPIGAPLVAEIYAPSRAAGFLRPGMDVLLRYQAYPYQKFGQHQGRIHEISGTAMRPDAMTLSSVMLPGGAPSEPLYRVRVSLARQGVTAYGREQPLKSGMALDASILLEQRRLYEWALEPLYTIAGRL